MKNIETTLAIKFNSPMRIPASAITNVSNKAFRGSFVGPKPLANIFGVILSDEVACKILGAPNILPIVDEIVAPQIPATNNCGKRHF